MRIAVIGAGGVGGYFGGRLAQSGADVTFLVRGDTLLALVEDGLTIQSPDGQRVTIGVQATDDPASVGTVDALIHTTKAPAFTDALTHALPVVGDDTIVVTTQNGVVTPDWASTLVNPTQVVPGVVRIFAQITSPGVIDHRGGPASLTLPRTIPTAGASTVAQQNLTALIAALHAASIATVVVDDIWPELWTKAMYVIPHGGLGALTDEPLGVIRDPAILRDTFAAAMREVDAVARARGVHLPADAVTQALAFVDLQAHGATASMQRDLREGRPSELDAQVGTIVRYGDAAGVPTPIHDLLWRALS